MQSGNLKSNGLFGVYSGMEFGKNQPTPKKPTPNTNPEESRIRLLPVLFSFQG